MATYNVDVNRVDPTSGQPVPDEYVNVSFPDTATMMNYYAALNMSVTQYQVVFPIQTDWINPHDQSTLPPDLSQPIVPVTPVTVITPTINTGIPSTSPDNIQSTVYRFILQTPDLTFPNGYRFDTGANYPACSSVNTSACQPQQFATLDDALAYATAHSEVPVMVQSSAQVWDIIAGNEPVPPPITSTGMSTGMLALIAAGLYFLTK
jgi:hypothetical protein